MWIVTTTLSGITSNRWECEMPPTADCPPSQLVNWLGDQTGLADADADGEGDGVTTGTNTMGDAAVTPLPS